MSQTPLPPPEVIGGQVLFLMPDPDHELTYVNLVQEIMRPRVGPPFDYNDEIGAWQLKFPLPHADRMEYMFELVWPDGRNEYVGDPTNPLRAGGPFGDKSVVEFAGYEPPKWLDRTDGDPGSYLETTVASRVLRAELRTVVWSAPGLEATDPAPVLIAHDGPEYDQLSALTLMLRTAIEDHRLPPMRAVLVAPFDRDQTYSASAAYSRALTYDVLPAIERLAPAPHGRSMRIGMGASLGALAMLHVHRSNPASFGGLFLQSGSYFRQRYDKVESGFVRFRRISRFMGRVLTAEAWPHPIPVAMTCGTIEENLANNRATRDALERQGYAVTLHENRDGHNWVGWRDTFDPHLVDLLTKCWAPAETIHA